MHEQPRKSAKPEDEAASVAKAQNLRALQTQFFSFHHHKIYTKDAIDLSAKLLEINPESYTAWNYRKLAVEHFLTQPESDPDSLKSVLDHELRVVESALRQNFQSYGAWHHRKWVISKGHSSIDQELKLLDKFQKADIQNFEVLWRSHSVEEATWETEESMRTQYPYLFPPARYWALQHSLVLLQKITSSKESLLQHCFQYKDSVSSGIGNPICLRLNNLALSRMGAFEKLLWVQILDLSHNELQSIEGLEAMQLLSCLSLSNNKLRSLTTLEPLRKLKSLRVLDISYNQIGDHSIDTTRYLCSSPLSHSVKVESMSSDVPIISYWEAFYIFKDLNQLDVVGNAIADEKFESVMVKIMPTLRRMDGKLLD